MISGIGIPPEFLSYSEQTEFARSLGMMNGKFVRSILVFQTMFGDQFTKMFRLLYKNEYLNDYDLKKKQRDLKKLNSRENDETILVDTEKERNKVAKDKSLLEDTYFDLDSLTVKFPPPQALNMTTITERITNSRDIIDFVTQTLVDPNDAELSTEFKRELTKDLLSTFEWDKYEKLLEKAKINKTETSIKNASMSGDDGGTSDFGGL